MKAIQILLLAAILPMMLVSCGRKSEIKEYDRKGRLIRKFSVKGGQLEGVSKSYYPKTGILESEITYKKGKMNGINKFFHKNGVKFSEVPVKENKLDGEANYYYENGSLVSTVIFKNNQKISQKIFHKNGKTALELNFVDNRYDGKYKICDNNGKELMSGVFKRGKPFSGIITSREKDRFDWDRGKKDKYMLKFEKGKLVDAKKLDKGFEKEWYFFKP